MKAQRYNIYFKKESPARLQASELLKNIIIFMRVQRYNIFKPKSIQ